MPSDLEPTLKAALENVAADWRLEELDFGLQVEATACGHGALAARAPEFAAQGVPGRRLRGRGVVFWTRHTWRTDEDALNSQII